MNPIARFVVSFLLVASALFAQNDLPVSSVILGNAPGDQIAPAVASNGTDFLSVWNDGRSALGGLYATRVNFRGEVLDETGIRIGGSGSPEVVWSGSSYVIVWMETTFSAEQPGAHYAIRVARVGSDGALLEAPRTLRDNAVGYIRNVASNGSRIVVAYTLDHSTTPKVALAVLDRDARTVALDVPVSQPASNNYGATVTSNGSDFLVVWTATSGVTNSMEAAHVDASGNVVGSTVLAQALPPADGALVASDGTDFLVFTRALTQTSDELQAMRVSPNLSIVRSARAVGAPANVTVEQPRVVWNNETYFLVWTDPFTRTILSQHLDRDGIALHQPTTVASFHSSGLVGYPNVASNGGGVLAVWNDSRFAVNPAMTPAYDVMSRLVDQSILIANPERLLSVSAPRQLAPSIAAGAGLTMTVWSEESGVYAGRVTPAGALDGRGILLASTGSAPHVIFDGTNFLVAWINFSTEPRSIHSARIDVDGHVLDTNVVANVCAVDLTLARGASSSLVAWTNCNRAVEAVRVGNDGRTIDSLPLTLTPANMAGGQLSAAWNGSEYLVAWEEQLPIQTVILFPMYRFNIRATRVSAALTLIDAQPISIAVSSDDEISNDSPDVASDGDDFLIAWHSRAGIAATHVSASGIVTNPAPLILSNGTGPKTEWDGVRYLVAWRTGSTIAATHVDGPGLPLPNDRITIATPLLTEPGVDLAMTSPGRVSAVYTRIDTEPKVGNVERAFVRALPIARTRVMRR